MPILDRYVSRLFLARFLFLLAGLSALAEVLDLFAHGDEVLARTGGHELLGLLRYAAARLPQVAVEMVPLAVLLAAVLTLAGLIRRNELVALGAAGVSQFRLLAAFMPAALLVAAGQFWVDDELVPRGVRALRAWGIDGYAGAPSPAGTRGDYPHAAWFRLDGDLVRVERIGAGGARLEGVSIFRRDAAGDLTERIDAATAEHARGRWILRDVVRRSIGPEHTAVRVARMPWDAGLPPRFPVPPADPEELSLPELWRLTDGSRPLDRPVAVYATLLHRKVASPLGAVLTLLLVVSLGQRFGPRRGVAPLIALGAACGFVYFIFDGVMLALGQAGRFPPAFAAWAPVLLLATAGGAIAFHQERPWRPVPVRPPAAAAPAQTRAEPIVTREALRDASPAPAQRMSL